MGALMSGIFLSTAPAVGLPERMAAVGRAIKAAASQDELLPRLLELRAGNHAFGDNFELAIADYRRALELVRAGTPLVPPFADGFSPIPPIKDGEAEILQDLGSTLQCAGLFEEANQHLASFVQLVEKEQPDHYSLPKACYELAVGSQGDIESLFFWIGRARKFEECRLPLFPAYESQKKDMALMFCQLAQAKGKGPKGTGRSRR